jgi:hypothetical protein
MITQAFKRWLHKLFGWLSGKPVADAEYAHAKTPLNTGMTSEPLTRPAMDGAAPPAGVAPLILGQGETSCSTLDEWPERPAQGSSSPPSPPAEKIELPTTPPPVPHAPPVETSLIAKESIPAKTKSTRPEIPPPPPTPEQKLEFLHYLVRRGIVNEGFTEGHIPRQYTFKNKKR